MTTALSVLRDELSEKVGDYLHDTVTTALAASTSLVCTRLNKVTNQDDYFNGWYVLITSENNDGVVRKISDYDEGTTTITVLGGNFTSDVAALATFEIHRYDPEDKERAINNASRELFPVLFKRLLDETLITGNALPNAHFKDWSQTTYPDHYSLTTAAALESTTVGTYRGGSRSMKVTASAADGYVYITSKDWPGLLDLMGQTINFKCWVYPQTTDDDPWIQIYTIKADGTEQELPADYAASDFDCPAGYWSLLELEDQSISDDIVEIQFRFRVHTATTEYSFFDNARVTGKNLYEYLLPLDFQKGTVSQVHLQSQGYSDDICDDLNLGANAYSELFGWRVVDDGTYKYLRTADKITANRKLKLIGYRPLEDNLSSTDTGTTLSLEGERLNLLLSYAIYLMYEIQRGTVSSDDVGRYDQECARWLGKAEMLKRRLKMRRPPSAIKWSL